MGLEAESSTNVRAGDADIVELQVEGFCEHTLNQVRHLSRCVDVQAGFCRFCEHSARLKRER